MSASTPPLVDVIAAALAGHWDARVGLDDDGTYYDCTCGAIQRTRESKHRSAREWSAAHQARAVLDALTKAGGVEWGIRYGDGDIDQGYLYKAEAEGDIARLRAKDQSHYDPANNEPMTLLKRRRFEHTGPWTAVEG